MTPTPTLFRNPDPDPTQVLDAAVGAVDGFVVARSLTHRGKGVTSAKAAALRGNGFSGGVSCPEVSAPPKDEERLSVVDAFKVSPTNPALRAAVPRSAATEQARAQAAAAEPEP